MPIQTNFAQAIALFHVPLPGSAKDAQRLRRAFDKEKLKKGKIAVIAVKDPITHGKVYRGDRIILQIAHPLPRVTRKGELKYLHYEDPDWEFQSEDAK